ncbi:MAG: hypothetical protein IT473_02360 [Lysobacter sp.]|nr:hypothetical protein [Lysobacter sp.]
MSQDTSMNASSMTAPFTTGPVDIDALPVTVANRPALPRIDYAADDHDSVAARLLQRLPEALPGWNARFLEEGGDYAIVLARLAAQMCAILDGYADHRANEGFLRTAMLPRSLMDLSALIDYAPGAGSSAATLQAFLAKPDQTGLLPSGFQITAPPLPGSSDTGPRIFQTLTALSVDPSRNTMRLIGYDRSGRMLALRNAAVATQDTAVLTDALYAGVKTGTPIVFDDGATLAAVPLTAAAEVDGVTELRWAAGAPTASVDFAIADTTIYGRNKQTMKLEAAERADEITLGQNTLPVVNATMFTVGGAVLVENGGLQFPAIVLGKDTNAKTVVLNRGVPASLRRSKTRVLEGTSCGGTTSTVRAGVTALYRDPLGYKKKEFPHTPDPGDLLLLADASGVEMATVASVSQNVIVLTQPTTRALRPTSRPFDLVARVRYYMLKPNDPSTHQTKLRPVLLVESPEVYQNGDTVLTLDKTYEGLAPGIVLGLSDGLRTRAHRVALADTVEGKTVLTLDGSVDGQFRVATMNVYGPYEHAMRVVGYDRSETTLASGLSQLDIVGAPVGLALGMDIVVADATHAEGARITQVQTIADGTRIALARPLEHGYALGDTVVYGNVASVSHGASVVDETLGSGDPTLAPQRFALRKSAVAFVPDANAARGVRPAVDVWVDGELWTAVETLAGSGPLDRHYAIDIDERERATVVFGDGVHGAVPPSGRNNLIAKYRIGHGGSANVAAAAIATMPRALPFLERSFNPLPASGGSDTETPDSIKRQAAHRVRTLDRAVALSDYLDLALSYSGVAKARADLEREGSGRAARSVIALTVAATGGSALSTPQKEALLAYLSARSADPARLRVRDYRPWPVRLSLRVNVSPRVLQSDVQRALLDAFGSAGFFGFDQRALGADLVLSDVYALAESIQGVDHLVATAFHAESDAETVADRIFVPSDALATGGDAADAAIGRFNLQLVGGLA